MKSKSCLVVSFLLFGSSVFGQEAVPTPASEIHAVQTLKSRELPQAKEVSREKREKAYAKLLEGQRYIWNITNARSQTNVSLGVRLAKESFLKAVELDPTLAEGYTALAELTYKSPPNDVDEAIRLANIAIKINGDNFGGHQVLARLQTHLSLLNRGILDKAEAQKAVDEWKHVVRLDPRNAEGYAFLGEFYGVLKQPALRIEALKNWLSAAQPVDAGFYSRIMGQQDLSPESALVKLGEALLKDGQARESVEILSRAISDNPNDDYAIELLNRAVESSDEQTAAKATDALQQAIFANPENIALINLLAEIYSNAGNFDGATKLLRGSVEKLKDKNKLAAVNLQISLGDIYSEGNRHEDAIAIYRSAFNFLGTESNRLVTDIDRDIAERIFEKLISSYKELSRPTDVKKTIVEASQLFGKDSLFADEMLIAFFRGNGQRAEALQTVRAARVRFPQDFNLLKLEAAVLTENGKVDEGVSLLRALVGKRSTVTPSGPNPPVFYDDFTNYIYISNLYSQVKRGTAAIEAAIQALLIAKGSDRVHSAKVTLASAYQMDGNFQAAEKELREVLALSPDNPYALNNLGYFLLERNERLPEALELIKRAVEISPSNPSFLDSLGWAYFKLKKWDDAERYLKSAIRFDSSSTTIFEHLGDVYEKQGNQELAKDNWRRALKIAADKDEVTRLKLKLGERTIK